MTESQENNNKDIDQNRLQREIEALLFASDAPLSASRLTGITSVSSIRAVKDAIAGLENFYKENERSFGIVEVAGGYQLVTLPEYAHSVAMLFKSRRKTRLTQAALETLAIIAYKQPINRLMIEAIRGVNCDGVLSTLIDRELVTISGRGEGVGKPYLYSTTTKFLEYLGLKDYRDLPEMEELEHNLENLELIPRPEQETEMTGENNSDEPECSDEQVTGELEEDTDALQDMDSEEGPESEERQESGEDGVAAGDSGITAEEDEDPAGPK